MSGSRHSNRKRGDSDEFRTPTGSDVTRITAVRSIVTAPDGIALVVVKVETSDEGLYGVGCATFTQRPTLVAAAVDD